MESIKNIGSLSKPIMYKEINQYLPPNKENQSQMKSIKDLKNYKNYIFKKKT